MCVLSNYLGRNADNDLSNLQDGIGQFDEVSCGGQQSLLGRYPGKYTLPTVMKLREKVLGTINK